MADDETVLTGAAVAEVRTWREADLAAPEDVHIGLFQAAVFSRAAPAKDGPNEDGALLLSFDDGRVVAAVADGIGGHAAGERASAAALEALKERLIEAASLGRELREGILDGFDLAHHRVTELSGNGGTTLIAISFDDAGARPFHVGDSGSLVTGQRGRLKLLTTSHSPVGYAVEAGLLDEEEAILHEDRHLVSNAIGIGAMKIEIGPALRLADRDTVVLGTDGLFDNLRTDEIVATVRAGRLDRAAAKLLATCSERMQMQDPAHPGKPDDLTYVLIRPRPKARKPER